jgi:hypothetical protein
LVYLGREWGRVSVKELGKRLHRDPSSSLNPDLGGIMSRGISVRIAYCIIMILFGEAVRFRFFLIRSCGIPRVRAAARHELLTYRGA